MLKIKISKQKKNSILVLIALIVFSAYRFYILPSHLYGLGMVDDYNIYSNIFAITIEMNDLSLKIYNLYILLFLFYIMLIFKKEHIKKTINPWILNIIFGTIIIISCSYFRNFFATIDKTFGITTESFSSSFAIIFTSNSHWYPVFNYFLVATLLMYFMWNIYPKLKKYYLI